MSHNHAPAHSPTAMPRVLRRRTGRPTPLAPLARFSSRAALERLARARRIRLCTTVDDNGALLCPVCMHPFQDTGDDARILLPTTGHALHESCAVACCRNQRSRELEARSQFRQGDERHRANSSYICEFARTPLAPGEVRALFLPPWPSVDQGWLDSETGYTQTFALVVPTGVAPGASFRASLSGVLTDVRPPDGALPGSTVFADARFRGRPARWHLVNVPAGTRPGDTFEVLVDGMPTTVTASRDAVVSTVVSILVPEAGVHPTSCDVLRVYARS